ncbi:MAG: hypothetical protein JO333_07585 [Verrucomicrobia bacterium]|nr:hypothetical protein [Verrucomicrobiota bacterium]
MADPLPSLDLRLTPDWLKESAQVNRYADYADEEAENRSHRGNRDRREDRNRRPGQNRQRRDSGSGRRDPAISRSGPQQRSPRPQNQPARDGNTSLHPDRGSDPSRRRREEPAIDQTEPAAVQVDFLPEERAFSKVIQQIKQGHAAYPLFGLARMFLERPERHRVRTRTLNDAVMLYQLGDEGPVAMEPAALERIAFNEKKDEFYSSKVIEKEPIKGNFTSVARCTLSGRVLGPTNYHTFQKAIRSLYEQRFSRRMSFEDYRRSIEITADPEVVNQWKEEARRVVTYVSNDSQDPAEFENLTAMEQHFRTHHLDKLVRPCLAAEVSGEVARHLPDRSIVASIRRARDKENRFPAQMAGALRHGLNQAGLHVFKHKKRILYISTVRPQLFDPNQAQVSPGLEAILATLRSYPRITRKQLAEKVLKRLLGDKSTDEKSPEYQQAKNSLPTDLLWLAKAGHVIEFADGTLDLPLPPKPVEQRAGSTQTSGQPAGDEHAELEAETGELPGSTEGEVLESGGDEKKEEAPLTEGATAQAEVPDEAVAPVESEPVRSGPQTAEVSSATAETHPASEQGPPTCGEGHADPPSNHSAPEQSSPQQEVPVASSEVESSNHTPLV